MTNLVIADHRKAMRAVLEALYVHQVTSPNACSLTEAQLIEQFGPGLDAVLCDLLERKYIMCFTDAYWITLTGRDYFDSTDKE